MKISEKGITLIKYFEGKETLYSLLPELRSYLCPSGVWTIGWGTTIYPDGVAVKKGDTCSIIQSQKWLFHDLTKFESDISRLVIIIPTEGQFDSLVSFGYNVGTGQKGLAGSTLLKRVNAGMTGELIEKAFLMWCKGNGERDGKDNDGDGIIDELGEKKMLEGLLRRRKAEYWLFEHNELKFDF